MACCRVWACQPWEQNGVGVGDFACSIRLFLFLTGCSIFTESNSHR
uniref:Uncharacterized protein n=1 Tax=Arundo donax TaxID=35708 RepID=A0A0A9EFT0_ARUDO